MDPSMGSQVEAVVRTLLGEPNKNLSSKTKLRYGTHGSLAVELTTGAWYDHENKCGGGLVELRCRVAGDSQNEAINWLKSNGINIHERGKRRSRIVATYDYRDETGKLLFEVVRKDPKSFLQRRPDGVGGYVWSSKDCRQVLYRLPELAAAADDEIVFLVEGEKDADRLAACGLVATTNAGGAGKWRDDFSEMLRGRSVVVIADNDRAGKAHAEMLEKSLRKYAKRVALLELDGLPAKGDVSDWLDAGGTAAELMENAAAAISTVEELALHPEPEPPRPNAQGRGGIADRNGLKPIPLMREPEAAAPVPVECLGPVRGPVEAIATLTQAPAAIALQSILGAASLVVQGHVNVETLVDTSPTSLALLTIAQSGERKSSCDKLALKAVREVERERLRDLQAERDQHEVDLAAYEVDRKAILKDGNNVERDAELEALGRSPSPPLDQSILFGDPTVEGLMRFFEEGQPSIGVFSDEGGQLLGGHAMNSENKLKSAATYSRFWDGSAVDRARGSGPAQRYYGRRVCIHLMVQNLVANKVLADETIRDQGLPSRLLIVCPESQIGFRKPPAKEEKEAAERDLDYFHTKMKELLARPLPVKSVPNELEPRTVRLSNEARALLEAFAEKVEVSQRPEGPCAGIKGVASKAAEQAARIAGVMTVFDNPDAQEVPIQFMISATGLMDWYLREARRLLDTGRISQQTLDAETLRQWMVAQWREEEIDVRTAVRFGPNHLRDTSYIKSLFKVLEANGWLVTLDVGGRRKPWRIVRS